MKTRDSWMYLCSFIIINTTIITIIIIIIFFIYFTFYFHCLFFFLCVAQVMVVLFLYSVLITVAGPTGQAVERTNRWSSEGEMGGATSTDFHVCPCVAVRRRTEDLRRRHPGTASSRVGGVKVSCCYLSKSNAKLMFTLPPHPLPNHHHLAAKK